MFRHDYPYTDFHELNLDWLLEKMKIFQEGYLDKYIKAGQLITPMIFGAEKDDLEDDSVAFHSFYGYDGGAKYIPSGSYLVDGVLRRFEYGCFGNGNEIVMPSYTFRDTYLNYGEYAFEKDGNGPINQNYEEFDTPADFKPINQTTFLVNHTGNFDWGSYNTGPVGYEVKGGIKGNSNGMPIGFRSVMFSEQGGDGDVVGVWSRVYKANPSDGVNNSDACAGHFSAICSDTGNGITMANELWAFNRKTQGQAGTNFSYFFNAGGIVGSQYVAKSNDGMAQAHILAGGTTNAKYGAWCVMTINNTGFKYNNRTNYPANTSVFKMADFTSAACPNIVNWYGYTPYHVKMNGAYDYNVGANRVKVFNSTLDGNSSLVVLRQANENTTESGKASTIALGHANYGGETHAPNIGSTYKLAWRVYHEYGNENIFYRTEGGDDGVSRRNHAFYCWDGTTEVGSLIITPTNIFAPNEQDLGSESFVFNELFTRSVRAKSPSTGYYGIKNADFSVFQCVNAFDVPTTKNRKFRVGHNTMIFIGSVRGMTVYMVFAAQARLMSGTEIEGVTLQYNADEVSVTISNASSTNLFVNVIVRNTEAYVEV